VEENVETRRLWQVAGEPYVEAQHGDYLETRRLASPESSRTRVTWVTSHPSGFEP
jgi:hypothetical protein